jgi:hypothetical protein
MSKNLRPVKKVWIAGAVFAIAILLAASRPIETLAAPTWDVCVVDQQEHPLKGVLVRESYQNYSADSVGRQDDAYRDQTGCVHFAPKISTSSALTLGLVTLNSAMAGVLASFGTYSYVIAFSGEVYADEVRNGYPTCGEGPPTTNIPCW